MIETVKENGLDPYKDLLYIMRATLKMNLEQEAELLLPWNVLLSK